MALGDKLRRPSKAHFNGYRRLANPHQNCVGYLLPAPYETASANSMLTLGPFLCHLESRRFEHLVISTHLGARVIAAKRAPTSVRISTGRPDARRGHAPGLTIPLWPTRLGWIDRKSDSWRKSCQQRQAMKCPLCEDCGWVCKTIPIDHGKVSTPASAAPPTASSVLSSVISFQVMFGPNVAWRLLVYRLDLGKNRAETIHDGLCIGCRGGYLQFWEVYLKGMSCAGGIVGGVDLSMDHLEDTGSNRGCFF
jgi:hypothetical protein